MSIGKLKKYYDHPLFHGIKTVAEAQAICEAEIQNFGKPGAGTNPDGTPFDPKNIYIWFLLDNGEYYSSVIFKYCESDEVPFKRVDEFHIFDFIIDDPDFSDKFPLKVS